MKILALILFLIPVFASAQTIEVREQSGQMSLGTKPGFYVYIPKANEKDVNKAWKSLMKDYNAKTSNYKNEMLADDAQLASLSSTPVDVYAVIEEDKGGTKFHVFYYIDNTFLSGADDAVKAAAAREMVYQFAVTQAKDAVKNELEAAEKELKSINKDLKDLKDEKKDLEDDIKDCEQTIEKAKKGLNDNASNTASMEKKVAEQEAKLKEIQRRLENVR